MARELILLRHGESEWNAKNLFTGWVDVSLSEKGVAEAMQHGVLAGYPVKDVRLLPAREFPLDEPARDREAEPAAAPAAIEAPKADKKDKKNS